MDQSSRNSSGKMAKRCSALEPVLEHCELAATSLPTCETILQQHCSSAQSQKTGKPLRFLSKLCDGYVKLMKDVASGADLGGVSSFYGAACGAPCTGDFAFSTAKSRIVVKETEKEQRLASQSQRGCSIEYRRF